MAEYTLICPLRINRSKRKLASLSMNTYRNLHFRTSNTIKKNFATIMRPQIEKLPFMEQCELHLTLYPQTRRSADLDNWGSICCKFLQDAMVKYKKILDDNYKIITKITFEFGEIDKVNPRMEVKVITQENDNE